MRKAAARKLTLMTKSLTNVVENPMSSEPHSAKMSQATATEGNQQGKGQPVE
jgi:hypothetical protein